MEKKSKNETYEITRKPCYLRNAIVITLSAAAGAAGAVFSDTEFTAAIVSFDATLAVFTTAKDLFIRYSMLVESVFDDR